MACSLYADDSLVEALAHVHSRENPHFVMDAAGVSGNSPASLASAKAELARIEAAAGRPLLGLLAVPASAAVAYGKVPEDLFDPCTNIAVGTAMLSQFAYECSGAPAPKPPAVPSLPQRDPTADVPRTSLRPCVVRKFGQALNVRSANHVETLVEGVQRALSLKRREDPRATTPEQSPIFFGEDEGTDAADEVFVEARREPVIAGGDQPARDRASLPGGEAAGRLPRH